MKKYNFLKKIVVSCISIFMFVSCNDKWFEILPKDVITYEDFWKTKSQLQGAVTACYRACIEDAVSQKMILWGELRTDEVVSGSSTAEENDLMNFNIIPSSKLCDWSGFYKVINNCNTVLENADRVRITDQTLSAEELTAFKSEALAIRSLMYFYLVRAFKEVPLVLIASTNASQNFDIKKSKEDVILNQIISDLKLASAGALSSYDNTSYDKGRFTKTSINALLSDVYLWAKDYPDCINSCNDVINDTRIALVDDQSRGNWLFNIFYAGNSNESIFEFQYSNGTGKKSTVMYSLYGGSDAGSAHLMVPTDKNNWDLSTIFDVNDIRSISFLKYNLTVTTSSPIGKIIKYAMKPSSTSYNWIVYRLADVYLMKAEALVQQDYEKNKLEALGIVNKIYLRAHPTFTASDSLLINAFDTKEKMDVLILGERQKEFLFEGKRWFDLVRYSNRDVNTIKIFNETIIRNLNLNIRDIATIKLQTEWSHYLPVPKNDIDNNTLLVQNPFYDTGIN